MERKTWNLRAYGGPWQSSIHSDTKKCRQPCRQIDRWMTQRKKNKQRSTSDKMHDTKANSLCRPFRRAHQFFSNRLPEDKTVSLNHRTGSSVYEGHHSSLCTCWLWMKVWFFRFSFSKTSTSSGGKWVVVKKKKKNQSCRDSRSDNLKEWAQLCFHHFHSTGFFLLHQREKHFNIC